MPPTEIKEQAKSGKLSDQALYWIEKEDYITWFRILGLTPFTPPSVPILPVLEPAAQRLVDVSVAGHGDLPVSTDFLHIKKVFAYVERISIRLVRKQ